VLSKESLETAAKACWDLIVRPSRPGGEAYGDISTMRDALGEVGAHNRALLALRHVLLAAAQAFGVSDGHSSVMQGIYAAWEGKGDAKRWTLLGEYRQPLPSKVWEMPMLAFDATGVDAFIRALWGEVEIKRAPRVLAHQGAKLVALNSEDVFGYGKITPETEWPPARGCAVTAPMLRIGRVFTLMRLIAQCEEAGGRAVGAVGPKAVEPWIIGMAEIAGLRFLCRSFGSQRGSRAMEGTGGGVVVSRPVPGAPALELKASTALQAPVVPLAAGDWMPRAPDAAIEMTTGLYRPALKREEHPDPVVRSYFDASCGAEVRQALGRFRPIRESGLNVVLNTVALGMAVDETIGIEEFNALTGVVGALLLAGFNDPRQRGWRPGAIALLRSVEAFHPVANPRGYIANSPMPQDEKWAKAWLDRQLRVDEGSGAAAKALLERLRDALATGAPNVSLFGDVGKFPISGPSPGYRQRRG
jgi:hypothetical protein